MDPLFCCYVFKGQSYSASQKLDKFIETAQSTTPIWKVLKSSGKSGQLITDEKPIESLVSEIFITSTA